MRVLLDECVPRRLKSELPDHEVRTAQEEGWAGMKNGALLRVAAGRFDLLLTADRHLPFPQEFPGLNIGGLALVGRSNRVKDRRPPIAPGSRRARRLAAGPT